MKKIIMTFGLVLTTLVSLAQTTVVDIIVNSEDHTLLEAAVVQEGLDGTLSGEGPFTVFAPTDSAFITLANTFELEPTDLLNLQNLTDILTYHVVGGSVLSTDLTDGLVVNAINGGALTFTVDTTGVMVNYAMVIVADIVADNGVVHVIDAVLVEPQVTNVIEIEDDRVNNGIYYNIMGQEIRSYEDIPLNGFYIRNGKKFIKTVE